MRLRLGDYVLWVELMQDAAAVRSDTGSLPSAPHRRRLARAGQLRTRRLLFSQERRRAAPTAAGRSAEPFEQPEPGAFEPASASPAQFARLRRSVQPRPGSDAAAKARPIRDQRGARDRRPIHSASIRGLPCRTRSGQSRSASAGFDDGFGLGRRRAHSRNAAALAGPRETRAGEPPAAIRGTCLAGRGSIACRHGSRRPNRRPPARRRRRTMRFAPRSCAGMGLDEARASRPRSASRRWRNSAASIG